jgi:2',3'-cyclic-nucleotide 2'-phosphodiesterase
VRILFLGDVVGRSGREAIARHLPDLKARLKPDATIINCENAAHGFGVTEGIVQELIGIGADCLTSGNHIWDQRETLGFIARESRLLRPLNFPKGTPGHGSALLDTPAGALLVINAMGRLFMDPLDDPFAAVDQVLDAHALGTAADAIVLDFHAEATSEKQAMGHFCDGRVSLVVGTHTHVPTADHMILSGGTAYLSDAGMCGDFDSVIGMRKEEPINRFLRKTPGARLEPADGEGTVCGVFVVTGKAGLAERIAPVRVGGRLEPQVPPAG